MPAFEEHPCLRDKIMFFLTFSGHLRYIVQCVGHRLEQHLFLNIMGKMLDDAQLM